MIKNKGVYTTECPECSRLIVMHVLNDGSISPNKCIHCEMGFEELEHGATRNTFVIVPKVEKFSIFGNKEAKEKNNVEEKTKINTNKNSAHKKSRKQKNWKKK